ncbi:hypothetical protein MRX96_050335 [Rhipicephalus microplus]
MVAVMWRELSPSCDMFNDRTDLEWRLTCCASRESSDFDLSDSDEEAPEEVAVWDDLEQDLEPDVDSSDEEPVHPVPAAPKRTALCKTTDSSPQAWVPDCVTHTAVKCEPCGDCSSTFKNTFRVKCGRRCLPL